MNESLRRQEEIFSQAQALPVGERTAFLARACAGDAALRQEIEDLLAAAALTTRALGRPVSIVPGPGDSITGGDAHGTRIGHYTLIRKLGEGGAGVVYEAEQSEPMRRTVALKVMKPGTDTVAAIARFEAERQALALMEHPNIARVFDAGTTDQGRLYFAMELVRGTRITEYCDDNRLATAVRLGLFVQVCHAVQHAHQKGIIHRDLKPSNVLVTMVDGLPVPKVIDFGIAKAVEGQLADGAAVTQLEQVIGTPAYMSPEQAAGADLDTRSDIYSLGVLLYELLTGRTPFDTEELLREGLEAVRRLIREQEAPRPSERLRTTGVGELATIAVKRGAEPPKLLRDIRGDLDWIALRALEKDRRRRYPTANELAADLERHMGNQPVFARPPTAWYLLGRLARRHRTPVAAGATVAAVLVLAAVVSTALAIRATRAEREQARLRLEADEARTLEAGQRVRAQAEEAKARTEAVRSAQVAQFLKDMLKGVGPSVALGRDTTLLREILDQTGKRLDQDLREQPAVEAELRQTIGGVYGDELHEWVKAEAMLRKALALQRQLHPTPHPAVVSALTDLAQLTNIRGNFQEAAPLFGEVVALQRELTGPLDPGLARALSRWGSQLLWIGDLDQADGVAREALAIYHRQPDGGGLGAAATLGLLAQVHCRRGEPEAGDAEFREALALARGGDGDEHRRLAVSLTQRYGMVYGARGDAPRMEMLWTECLEAQRQLHGDNHPEVAKWRSWLGWAILGRRDFARALATFRQAEVEQRKLLGDQHSFLVYALEGEARALLFLGDFSAAETAAREARDVVRRKHGPDNSLFARPTFTLAVILFQRGRQEEARDLLAETLAAAWKDWPDGTSNVFAALRAFEDRQLDDMLRRPVEAILQATLRRSTPPDHEHPDMADTLGLLGALRYWRGAYAEAEADFRQALVIRQQALGPNHRAVAQLRFSVAAALRRQGRPAEARALLEQVLASDEGNAKEPDVAVLWTLNELGRVQMECGDPAGAEASFRESLAIAPKVDAARHEDQAEATDGLGVALAYRRKYAEAEQALRAASRHVQFQNLGGDGLRNPDLPRTIAEHFVHLYLEWAKIEPTRAAEAEPWKARLPDLTTVETAVKKPYPLPPATKAP